MEHNQISIRVAGASGSAKQAVVNFLMEAFRVGGNSVGSQMEGTISASPVNIPYYTFDAICTGEEQGSGKWGLSKNKVVRIPHDLLIPRLSTALIKQGFIPLAERHPLIEEFLESVSDDYSGSLINDGVRFEADRAKHMFEGFCMGRGHKQ